MREELKKYKERFENGENPTELMTAMEREFKIPMLLDAEFNKNNADVIKLYRKISDSRIFEN